jgi:acetylornithine deacetylase/succinyl-diaminopimelate desuccinylase-like protein
VTDLIGEATELFRRLLRLDTTNPPGRETQAAELLERHLADAGIEGEIFEKEPGRGNLVARLEATVDPQKRVGGPLLLTGHTDVVPAEASRWTHPPFEAVEADGCIWGRGAVDMKHMVAMSATVMKALAASDRPLRRDVIFAAVADEERGCEYGSKYLVEEHADKVGADVMLGEVGGFWLDVEGHTFVPVQVAEKGRARVRLTARGPSGHGSIPRRDTAFGELSRAVELLTTRRLPHHRSAVVEAFVRTLAEPQSVPTKLALLGLLRPATAGFVIDHLIGEADKARNFDALLHNTVTPTRARVGDQLNVIPGEATVECDGRIAPGSSAETLRREVEALLGDHGLSVDVTVDGEMPPVQTDTDAGGVLEAIESVCAERAPSATVVPYMIPGYTDAQYFSRLGTRCYGFAPLKLDADSDLVFADLFHGVDERVPIEGFQWGVQTLLEVVERLVH